VPGDVTLRPCVVEDAAALAAMYASDRDPSRDDESSPPSVFFTAAGQRDRITRIWPEHDCAGYVAERGDDIVGLFVLEDIADDCATVGYFVDSAARGRGVATAALGRLVEIGLETMGLVRLVADIEPDNLASRRVAERNGFRAVGRIVLEGVTYERFVAGAPAGESEH
jgi:ribosomal-protein-alanine N-acetyltransferase